ncbi:ribosomal protein S8 [Obelidium mucronatum]|nr:ribosomal protein S8 [Obelidium mucronatum]
MGHYWHLCSHIHNAFKQRLVQVAVPASKQNAAIVRILLAEGFLGGVAQGDVHGPFQLGVPVPVTPDNVAQRRLWLDLKYARGDAVLSDLRAVSKPSRRVFATAHELKMIAAARRAGPLLKGQQVGQVTILDTEYGIIELKDALKKNVGGEVLCIAK